MIRAENIGFKYKCGRVVLSEINFSLNDGEIAAILGNNGAGKSTLLKCTNNIGNSERVQFELGYSLSCA